MENNTYFIVSQTDKKATVMNRYTREAVTRKITKGKIVINREHYLLEDMEVLTESMQKMKELESQGCKPVNTNEVFFSTTLRHDTHDLLFYLDMYGLIMVNGMPYSTSSNKHADDRPVRKNTPLLGAVSTTGEVFFGDVDDRLIEKITSDTFLLDGKKMQFNDMEELKQVVGEMISNHYVEIESTVAFGLFSSPSNPNLVLNFYYADEQELGFRKRHAITFESVKAMNDVKPVDLQEWARLTSLMVKPQRKKRLSS